MFKKLFKKEIKDIQLWKLTLGLTLLLFIILLVVFLLVDRDTSKKVSIGFIILTLLAVIGNWFTNVRMPISKARREKFDPKILEAYKDEKTKLSKYQYSELFLFSKGLAFITASFIPLIITIIFTVI